MIFGSFFQLHLDENYNNFEKNRTKVEDLISNQLADKNILNATLDRAVDKGFISPSDRLEVYKKIKDMADKHGFDPDDFPEGVNSYGWGGKKRKSRKNRKLKKYTKRTVLYKKPNTYSK